MDSAAQVYLEYVGYIKFIKAERNEKIKNAIKSQIVTAKNKIGKFNKRQIKKFKQSIKDIDLDVQQQFLNILEYLITNQIKLIEFINRFEKNVSRKVNSSKNRVNRFKKQQIKKFKKKIKKINKNIKSFRVKISKTTNRFKKNVSRKVNSSKNRVNRFKKQQIKKFKNTFMSNDKVRQQKQNQINSRRQKIEELKQYRNQLMMASSYSMTQSMSGPTRVRSRGVLYIWMFALVGLVAMFTLMALNIIK